MRLRSFLLLVCVLSPAQRVLTSTPIVDGQQAATRNAAPNHAWELELVAGTVAGSDAVDGAGTLPPTRPPVVETFPFLVSTQTIPTFPSWYYGGGAAYLDRLRPSLRFGMTGVDPVLTTASAIHQRAATLGFRVSRGVTGRVRVEFSMERRRATFDLTHAARAAIEKSRAEFATFFGGVGESFRSVTSTAVFDASNGSEIATTGSVVVDVRSISRVTPFVRVGAGVLSRTGELPRVTLHGEYVAGALVVIPGFPPLGVAQSDTLTIRYDAPSHAFVGVIGGGLRYDLSRRLSARIAATSYVGSEQQSIRIDANPTTRSMSNDDQGALTIIFGFSPTGGESLRLRFDTDPARPSSLHGPPIRDFETFSGRALRARLSVTGGLSWRF